MKCPQCAFDDTRHIAEISGFQKVWPWQRGDLIADYMSDRSRTMITRNGILQSYHIGHLAGAIDCYVSREDGFMYSKGIPIDDKKARMN